MQLTLGSDLVATLVAPGVLPEYPEGARVEVPYTRAIVAYWRPAAYDPVSGLWTVAIPWSDLLLPAGEYNLVWRTSGPDPQPDEVFIPLSITSNLGGTVPEPGGAYAWAPTVEEVAEVTPAYTRGGFDDDRPSAGAELVTAGGLPTYGDTTVPTATHVEGLITAACDEVQGRVGVLIPASQYGLAKTTAKWHVAAAIASGKQPANTDDASGEYRGHIANFRASLDALIILARRGAVRLR